MTSGSARKTSIWMGSETLQFRLRQMMVNNHKTCSCWNAFGQDRLHASL